MIRNGSSLHTAAPIKGMATSKLKAHGVSYGLTEAGYDIRIKQHIVFRPKDNAIEVLHSQEEEYIKESGRFVLASAIEEFDMPESLVGVVHDKSTWARHGLSVFNTVIEPGWKGFLTLELVYHGNDELIIPAGAGIAQVLFHQLERPGRYKGKYQHQANRPVPAKSSP